MPLPKRKLPRYSEYDYSTPGIYFITICTHNKACLFGNIPKATPNEDIAIVYSSIGLIAKEQLLQVEKHYDNVQIDNWVIMPNHIHLLVRISERINPFPTIAFDISNIIGKYKAAVTRNAKNTLNYANNLWQTSFYDHIVRDENDYLKIWQYISGNPSKWIDDCFYIPTP
ncbi:MAG: transposase [Oscillospiraceae bacterium]|nr:transposase [Oscillospiraceae bacterium]